MASRLSNYFSFSRTERIVRSSLSILEFENSLSWYSETILKLCGLDAIHIYHAVSEFHIVCCAVNAKPSKLALSNSNWYITMLWSQGSQHWNSYIVRNIYIHVQGEKLVLLDVSHFTKFRKRSRQYTSEATGIILLNGETFFNPCSLPTVWFSVSSVNSHSP